ncbi:MAG: hypothetical protein FJ276_08110 [Planctomycetes bacterium]|nr:hypothetical protein [Planctomycetota bacterium]
MVPPQVEQAAQQGFQRAPQADFSDQQQRQQQDHQAADQDGRNGQGRPPFWSEECSLKIG